MASIQETQQAIDEGIASIEAALISETSEVAGLFESAKAELVAKINELQAQIDAAGVPVNLDFSAEIAKLGEVATRIQGISDAVVAPVE